MNKTRIVVFLMLVMGTLFAELPTPDVSIMVPMRDGTQLPTDLYLPSPSAKHLPCLLVRTPSNRKSPYIETIAQMAQYGYVVAIQDTRNTLDTEGKTMPFLSDGWSTHQDGYDTVEWLAKSEWTNGNIGTIGWSAMGITQLLMAPTAPPHLKCQYIAVAAPNLYEHAMYGGGEFHKDTVEGWLHYHAPHPNVMRCIVTKPTYVAFWEQFNSIPQAHKVVNPAIHLGGWYDLFLQGTIDGFTAIQEHGAVGAKGTQKLLIGPWSHFWPKEQQLGDFPVPETGKTPPYDLSTKAWFDHYLKGVDNGVTQLPAVTYYVMGPFDGTASKGNVWKTAQNWPIPHTSTSFYLEGQGKLTTDQKISKAVQPYPFDAKNPCPTIGGRNLFRESGAKDQRPLESRQDVLVFTTNALDADMEITGRLKAVMHVSSDQPVMDVAIRLSDVYPDGRSILVADGLSKAVKLSSDASKEVEIDLLSTSMVFAKGHCIRVSVSSSNYPAYENCLKDKTVVAQNKLYLGKEKPSRIILPVVK